jgi:acyl carrier protein
MTPEHARDLVFEVLGGIAPEADPGTLRGDEDLRAALDLDSMDFLTFVVALHDRTGLGIPEADYPKLQTLDGCVAYLSGPGQHR